MQDFIMKILNLKDEDVHSIDSITEKDSSFFITLKRSPQICPYCGSVTQTIKDYSIRKISHKVLIHSDTIIYYRSRRYLCKSCRHSFVESNPFTSKPSTISSATVIGILKALKPYNAVYTKVAELYGVSPSTVISLFDRHVQIRRKRLPQIMLWDEFYFNRHSRYKYAFMIMDFRSKVITDIIESRHSDRLSDYFFHIPPEERKEVKYICMDMYRPYHTVASVFFPEAVRAVDPFHVIAHINKALDKRRKKVMSRYASDKTSGEYKLLKFNKKLLMRSRNRIDNEKYFRSRTLGYTTTEQGLLEEILNIDVKLYEAYHLKELYRDFNDDNDENTTRESLEEQLDDIIKKFMKSSVSEFTELAGTIKSFRTEILDSFIWFDKRRLSNGAIEGKNNYIKKILSNANGMSNFERARNRLLYSLNLYDTYTLSEHDNKIKREGKKRGKYKKRNKSK